MIKAIYDTDSPEPLDEDEEIRECRGYAEAEAETEEEGLPQWPN